MKTTGFYTLFALLMVFTVGCNKPDEPNNGGNNNGGNGDNSLNGHKYVDLGLPSGTLWATCNVGADKPEDYGDYFAWGETQPKDYYDWNTYQYCNGSENTLIKYCDISYYGYNGFTDTLTILLPEDDAAASNWGDGWRMPSEEQWDELKTNTTITRTTENGVNGWCFTGSNGNSVFLPAAGHHQVDELCHEGYTGNYWSRSLAIYESISARQLGLFTDVCSIGYGERRGGLSVRPVTFPH